MKNIVLTGGGTGGHIIPNLALVPILTRYFNIYYLGEQNSLEEEIITKHKNITFVPIHAVKLERKLTLKNLFIPFKLIKYIRECKKKLKEIKPSVIFSKGGFVSLPVAIAGKKLNIPVFSHESDLSMGLANKIILRYSNILFTSFRETCVGNKCVYSGNPIRKEVFNGNKEIAKNICNFKTHKPVLLFFGGSKGSQFINQFVFSNIKKLSNFNIIHFVGKNNLKNINEDNYFQIDFAENIYDFFALADIVICRAGANSIFELLAIKKLMLLIPLSAKISRGDQIENAKSFQKSGFANIIFEEELSLKTFQDKISELQQNKEYFFTNMGNSSIKNANKIICDYLIKYSK